MEAFDGNSLINGGMFIAMITGGKHEQKHAWKHPRNLTLEIVLILGCQSILRAFQNEPINHCRPTQFLTHTSTNHLPNT